MEKDIYSGSSFNTLCIDIKHKCEKALRKMYSLFFSRAQTHRFTFNLHFLYGLKRKVHLSKTVCGIIHFRFRIFIKVYFFVPQKA